MPTFSNVRDLYKYIKRQTRYPLEQVAIKVEEILKDYIIREWYNRMTPEDYSRTYEFINSLTVSKVLEVSNGLSVKIYFDDNKINPMSADSDRFWNKHMSIDKDDVSESIPYYIEYGNKSPIYNYEGIHMVENTIEYCKQYNIPVKEMIKELKSKGFTVFK